MRGGRGIRTPLKSQLAASCDLHIVLGIEFPNFVAAHVRRCEVRDRITCRGLPNRSIAQISGTHPDSLQTSACADLSDKGSGDSSESEELHSWLGCTIAEVGASLNSI